MQPWLLGRRTMAVRARTPVGRAWRLLLVLVVTLATGCSPGDKAPLALLGEGGLAADSSSTDQEEALTSQRSAASSGGSAADFDDLVLFPLVLQGPGLSAYAADCDFENEPFSSCL